MDGGLMANDAVLNPSFYSPGLLDQSQMGAVMQQGNNQARDQALSSGLMAAGAGLLGANNLSEGLSQGLSGFNKAYDTSLVANRPKVTPLADGAFSQISFPDGTVQVVSNPDVEKAILKREELKSANALTRSLVGPLAVSGREADKKEMDMGYKAQDQLTGINSSIGSFQRVLEATKDRGLWAQTQSTPLFKSVTDFFGSPDAAGSKMLQELQVDEALRKTAMTKGAISNDEMKLFLSPIPAATADMETVWKPWIQNKISVMEKMKPVLNEQIQVGRDAALGKNTRASIVAGVGTVANAPGLGGTQPQPQGTPKIKAPALNIPGLSSETSDWLSKNGY